MSDLKKFIKPLIYIVLIFFVVTFAFSFGALMGLAVMLSGTAVLIFVLRADLMCIYAQYLYQKDHGKAFLWFERAMKTDKMRPQLTLTYAYMLIREGVLDKSERIINKIMFMHKDKLPDQYKSASHLNLSIIKWKRGQLTEAIEELEEVYESGFRSTVMYGTLGTYYLLNGQYSKALEFNKEALDYNDTDQIIRDNLALNYYLCGNINAADELYDELIDEEPAFIEPYYNYGMVLEHMGEYEAAMANYEKALTITVKYLSTVSHEQVEAAIASLKEKMGGESPVVIDEAPQIEEEAPVTDAEEQSEEE